MIFNFEAREFITPPNTFLDQKREPWGLPRDCMTYIYEKVLYLFMLKIETLNRKKRNILPQLNGMDQNVFRFILNGKEWQGQQRDYKCHL